jgi:hypothetical protein
LEIFSEAMASNSAAWSPAPPGGLEMIRIFPCFGLSLY